MLNKVRAVTRADIIVPRTSRIPWELVLVIIFGTLMALYARIAIYLPFTAVPITGQTLGVLLTGALLGSRRGALAMVAYLGEGFVGLPVFAGGTSAWSLSVLGEPVIAGPTAGYLFSYPLAAFLVGFLAERGWDRRFWRALAAMMVGEITIYAIGLPWLALFVGPAQALPLGLLPFIPGDIVKLLLAAAVLPSGWRFLTAIGWVRPGTHPTDP